MKIYLKGYYGYKNFGDELLLFGVIEEIFSRYHVEKLVIEVDNLERIEQWKRQNLTFLTDYYQSKNITIDRSIIQFFSPDDYFSQISHHPWLKKLPKKILTHINIFLGNHPFRNFFKIFGGGEVLDESRTFPHNGRNLLLLYAKTIFQGNFALWGGLGRQQSFLTRWLTRFLVQSAQSLLLREAHSFKICQHILGKHQNKAELFQDFSKNLIIFWKQQQKEENTDLKTKSTLLNLSPSLSIQARNKRKGELPHNEDIIFFPCDLNFDLSTVQKILGYPLSIYYRTNHTLPETFSLLSESKKGIGSRLHFLYCLKHLDTPYISISTHTKNSYNL